MQNVCHGRYKDLLLRHKGMMILQYLQDAAIVYSKIFQERYPLHVPRIVLIKTLVTFWIISTFGATQ